MYLQTCDKHLKFVLEILVFFIKFLCKLQSAQTPRISNLRHRTLFGVISFDAVRYRLAILVPFRIIKLLLFVCRLFFLGLAFTLLGGCRRPILLRHSWPPATMLKKLSRGETLNRTESRVEMAGTPVFFDDDLSGEVILPHEVLPMGSMYVYDIEIAP